MSAILMIILDLAAATVCPCHFKSPVPHTPRKQKSILHYTLWDAAIHLWWSQHSHKVTSMISVCAQLTIYEGEGRRVDNWWPDSGTHYDHHLSPILLFGRKNTCNYPQISRRCRLTECSCKLCITRATLTVEAMNTNVSGDLLPIRCSSRFSTGTEFLLGWLSKGTLQTLICLGIMEMVVTLPFDFALAWDARLEEKGVLLSACDGMPPSGTPQKDSDTC